MYVGTFRRPRISPRPLRVCLGLVSEHPTYTGVSDAWDTVEGHHPIGSVIATRYKKSAAQGVCGLAWNSGVAGIRSVAVGLARTLRVGELVELVDVGLGNHDVDGGEHEWVPRGIVLVIVSLLDEAGDRPAVLVRGARQRG